MPNRTSSHRLLASLLASGTALSAAACNGQTTAVLAPDPADPVGLSEGNGRGEQQTSGKVDLLFAVDNSSSMRPKQVLLAQAASRLVDRLVKPYCRDAQGAAQIQSSLDPRGDAVCPSGTALEFAQVRDLHVGVLTSSLGNAGHTGLDAICDGENGRIVSDHALLVTRNLGNAPSENGNFLAYGAGSGTQPYADIDDLEKSLENIVLGVGDRGCGVEDQLESVYQFLAAPDPWAEIAIPDAANGKALYAGYNDSLLLQRHDFLRPDSLLSVVLVSDEDDASIDPLSVGGTGHYFKASTFPGGTERGDGTRTAARGTSACEEAPASAACTSCAFAMSDPVVAADPNCANGGGYYGPSDDDLNVRFFDMKRRFGIDPLYPLERYVRGLSQVGVPKRDDEHVSLTVPNPTTLYDTRAGGCRNPLFAAALPSSSHEEMCNLQPGPRNPTLVYFTVLGGVPNDLIAPDRLDADGRLRDESWRAILGADFATSNRDGMDPRLVQSIAPRPGRPGTDAPDAVDPDPDNQTHRDWDTKKADLQYACSYLLPSSLVVPSTDALDCRRDSDAPLCERTRKNMDRAQIRARAYPTPRAFAVAKALGRQSTVASLCPRDTSHPEAATYGYRPAIDALVDRMAAGLAK